MPVLKELMESERSHCCSLVVIYLFFIHSPIIAIHTNVSVYADLYLDLQKYS